MPSNLKFRAKKYVQRDEDPALAKRSEEEPSIFCYFDRHKRIDHSMALNSFIYYLFTTSTPSGRWSLGFGTELKIRSHSHRINMIQGRSRATDTRLNDWMCDCTWHSIESLLFVVVFLFLRWCQYKWRARKLRVKNAVILYVHFSRRDPCVKAAGAFSSISNSIFTLKLSPRFIGSTVMKSNHAGAYTEGR